MVDDWARVQIPNPRNFLTLDIDKRICSKEQKKVKELDRIRPSARLFGDYGEIEMETEM